MQQVNICFHGAPFTGKLSCFDFLKTHKKIDIISEERIGYMRHPIFKIRFKMTERAKDCKNFLTDIEVVLQISSGVSFYPKKIFEFITREIDGLIFFFDILKARKEMSQDYWHEMLEELPLILKKEVSEIPIVICYNKIDYRLEEETRQQCHDVKRMNKKLNKYNFPYFGTSTKTGENIQIALETLLKLIVKNKI